MLCVHFPIAYDDKSVLVQCCNTFQGFLVMHTEHWHGKVNGAMETEFTYCLEQDGTEV